MRHGKGSVMILVLGVLVILSLLGMTFVTLQKTEQLVSKSFTDQVRARMLASAGLEDVMSRAQEVVAGTRWSTFQGNGTNPADMQWPQAVSINDPVPLEYAKRPSWYVQNPPTTNPNPTPGPPRLLTIQTPCGAPAPDLQIGVTGAATWGPYGANTAIYSVKVEDTSAKIHVNDGAGLFRNPDSAGACAAGQAHSTVSQNLKWILNQLGWALGLPANIRAGNQIVDYRDTNFPAGFSSVGEVKNALTGLTEKQKMLLTSFVTTQAWLDKNVADPVPLSSAVYPPSAGDLAAPCPTGYRVLYNRGNATSPRLRFGRSVNSYGAPVNVPLRWCGAPGTSGTYNPLSGYGGPELYAMDELAPQYIEIVHRAPVNVNVASKPVLEAMIANVEGSFWVERRTGAPVSNSPPTFSLTVKGYYGAYVPPLSVTTAAGNTGPYTGWSWLYIHHGFAPGNTENLNLIGQGNGTTQGGTCPNSARRDYDELGFLYKSGKIYGSWEAPPPGSTTAAAIADHIIACRSLTTAAAPAGPVNYAGQPFGGPFRTWAQFHAFVDNLVAVGVIKDTTNTYWDYNPTGEGAAGSPWSWSQGTHPVANQAMADALKANFNPNLHMNYLNPDENMFQRVDKISLVKHTTEFSFTTSGLVEIESLGRVLEPCDAAANPLVTPNPDAFGPGVVNRVRAEVKIVASVRLLEKYREDSQRHFNVGQLSGRQSGPETNNNTGLRTGPESINVPYPYWDSWNGYTEALIPAGMAPGQNDGYLGALPNPALTGWGFEAEGYLALDTYGSYNHSTTISKPPAAPVNTQTGAQGPDLAAGLHGHFTYHNMLCHSSSVTSPADGALRELGGHANYTGISGTGDTFPNTWYLNINATKRTRYRNYAPPGETARPPYDPTKGDKFFRAYRSFRIPAANDTGASAAWSNTKSKMAPLPMNHLRADGMYSERHSGLAYWLTWGFTISNKWYAAVWFKPNWAPEWTGRSRNLIALSKYQNYNRGFRNPLNLNLSFLPAHMARHVAAQAGVTEPNEAANVSYVGNPTGQGSDAPEESVGGNHVNRIRPCSIFFSNWYNCAGGALHDVMAEGPWLEAHYGINSRTLNHRGHAPHTPQPANPVEAHRWSLLGFQMWDDPGGYSPEPALQLWMNLWYAGGKQEPTSTHWQVTGIWANANELDYIHRSLVNADNNASHPSPLPHVTNAIRLGETSQHGVRIESSGPGLGSGQYRFPRNYVADATFDELYLWLNPPTKLTSAAPPNMQLLYARGRYYRPILNNPQDCLFTSASILLTGSTPARSLAGTGGATPPGGGSMTGIPSPPATAKPRRLVGVSWTSFSEGWEAAPNPAPGELPAQVMRPHVQDYARSPSGAAGGLQANQPPFRMLQTAAPDPVDGKQKYRPVCLVRIQFSGSAPNLWTPWLIDPGFSRVVDPGTGSAPVLQSGSGVAYQVWFQIDGAQPTSLILVTPYFDDITLFFDRGGPELLSIQYVPVYVPPCS